ncbi:MAG: magnesium transporter [Oscillospiraceae bacterium]|nr:magnesium transporter [Oscillospiraceae bacterium]
MLTQTIATLVANKDLDELKKLLAGLEDVELQFAFNDLSDEEQVITFRLLSKAAALTLFDQLDTEHQENLLGSFTNEKTIEFVNELAPDDRVRLLDELPAGVARQLIANLSPQERKITNLLLGYEDETAGRIMTTEFISLRRNMTVEQALQRVREQARDKETIYTLYVTDGAKKLKGVISLKELILAQPSDVIDSIMTKNAIRVHTGTDQEEVARTLQEMDLLALPVVDKEERLVGIVTVDDAMDILEEEATEDIFDRAGITGNETDRSDLLVNGSLWRIWKVRLPILIVTLGFAFVAGFIVDGFEEALESIAAVAIFIPLIMGMSGNVGTQSSTVFARGVVLGQIDMKKFAKPFLKEILVGLTIGLMLGVLTGVIAGLWHNAALGLAVGLALIVAITVASLLGFFVPFLLIKLNLDQAAGSAPIITSIKDIVALLIYFLFVYLFIGVSYYGV